ncbi:MAG TPA: phosphate ABC transporter permease subunit PstC [Streptosporangiaceae bacterium]
MTLPHAQVPPDVPRHITSRVSGGDKVFRVVVRGAGLTVLVITGLILTFLLIRAWNAFKVMGFRFFTTRNFDVASTFSSKSNDFGVAALLADGFIIAAIALILAIPIGVMTGLYISEYAPHRLRRALIAVIDLMAAIPSIIYALWGLFFLMGRMTGLESWLARHLAFLPIFHVTGAASALPAVFTDSPFVVGVVVSLMVIPIITSLTREFFSQAPQPEREAAYALGATRWGMVRTVVLPFGRAGIIGACLLGMGRALGDAVIISFLGSVLAVGAINSHVPQSGVNSIPLQILLHFTSGPTWVAALMAAGLVLFAVTLLINVLGSLITGRSRAGLVNVD